MEMNLDWLSNPEIFNVNRLDATSFHICYANKEEMEKENSSYIHLLNGIWKFHYASSLNQTIDEFKDENYDCSLWDDIIVPCHIELQGYGSLMYVNQQYPWSSSEKLIPGDIPKFNPVSSYVRYFDSSILKENTNTRICFEGAESGLALWINGKFVGYSEDSFTPSTFDITNYIKKGKNKIAVNVYRFTSGSWLEDQDFFRFSGIFRDVKLISIPKVHLEDLKIIEDTSDLSNVRVNVETKMLGEGYSLKMSLYDKDNNLIDYKITNKDASFNISNPHLWWDEDPYLYSLIIEIKDGDGVVEVIKQKIGIRRFEKKNGIMYINGKRIVFHGVNRHEFSCYSGRVVDKEMTRNDLLNMKANNINAVRTSHYPNNNFFYDLCDEIGLYVIDEVNMETHGTWAELFDKKHIIPNDDPKWLANIIDRANSMIERDKNHPCIIIWSCGNESYGGKDIYELSNYIRKKDPSRLVHYEGVANDDRYPDTSDMISRMYMKVKDIEIILKNNPDKPFILCEYAHSMGNSNGALYKYTDLEKKYKNYQGGFIWDYVDQAIYKDNKLNYGGDFKERPSDYDFCGNGIMFADRTPTPKLQEVKYCYRWIKTDINEKKITIHNDYYTKNLNEFEITLSLLKDGFEVDKKLLKLDCKPNSMLVIDNPFIIDNKGEYALTISYSKDNNIVSYDQYIYPYINEEKHILKKISVNEDFLNIGVVGENFKVIFNKKKGLVSYKVNSYEFIRVPLKPNFFRASTNNDVENFYGFRYGEWLTNSLYAKCIFNDYKYNETSCTINYEYILPSISNTLKLSYIVYGDGEVVIDSYLDNTNNHIEMPCFGLLIQTYSDLDNVSYYGLGPKENYIDRNKGALLGRFKYKVEDNFTPYLYPQECGNRTGVRDFKLYSKGHSLSIKGDKIEFSVLPYTPYEIENARHKDELPNRYQTVISINEKQMGVGGDDTWGALTHEEFLLSKDNHHLRISIKGE